MKTETMLLFGGAAVVLYLLMQNNSTSSAAVVTTSNPQGLVGTNSGIKGGNGSFYTCSNYAALLAAVPNLGNPNYKLSDDEANQYLSNYLDLQQGLPSRIGNTSKQWGKMNTIQDACRDHWTNSGCAEKRIFVPLVPPSTGNYVPPTSSSSGGSWVSSALSIAGTIVAAVAGVGDDYSLTDKDVEVLITGAAILKDILPLYQPAQSGLVNAASTRLNTLLSQYV